MDGHGFTGGHILILMMNCFQKAASARYVTSVWIYTLYACQNCNGLQLQSLLCINIQKNYFVSALLKQLKYLNIIVKIHSKNSVRVHRKGKILHVRTWDKFYWLFKQRWPKL